MSNVNVTVSRDELEKAASVRLFEKVASANNIDLNRLSDEKIAELYNEFTENVLPQLLAEPSPAEEVEAKIASLSQDQIIELFEKQAAAEPAIVEFGGLEALSDEQLKLGFAHFVDQVLPIMAAQNFEPITEEQAVKMAEYHDAQVKLAEAEILGRHMARGFFAESEKLAAGELSNEEYEKEAAINMAAGKEAFGRMAGRASAGAKAMGESAKTYGARASESVKGMGSRAGAAARDASGRAKNVGERLKETALNNPRTTAAGVGVLTGGAAAMAAKKHMDKKGSVTLSAEDVATIAKLATIGDLAGLQKAAAAIVKESDFPPMKDEDEEKKDKKKKDKDEEEPEEKKASSALDFLIEARANELHSDWLRSQGQ